MRIISGELKGRSIKFLKNSVTRPLKDNVKESIFNILKHSKFLKVGVNNSNVLDVYSGIGSFGIECISRDAKKVTFVEENSTASKFLNQNLVNLSIAHKTNIFNDKIENILPQISKEKFNIFFFDPPFADSGFTKIIESVKKGKLFKKDHVVIIHRERKTKDKLENLINISEVKFYGRSKIIFGEFN